MGFVLWGGGVGQEVLSSVSSVPGAKSICMAGLCTIYLGAEKENSRSCFRPQEPNQSQKATENRLRALPGVTESLRTIQSFRLAPPPLMFTDAWRCGIHPLLPAGLSFLCHPVYLQP